MHCNSSERIDKRPAYFLNNVGGKQELYTKPCVGGNYFKHWTNYYVWITYPIQPFRALHVREEYLKTIIIISFVDYVNLVT